MCIVPLRVTLELVSTSASHSGNGVDVFVPLLYAQCKKPPPGLTASQWKDHFDWMNVGCVQCCRSGSMEHAALYKWPLICPACIASIRRTN